MNRVDMKKIIVYNYTNLKILKIKQFKDNTAQ